MAQNLLETLNVRMVGNGEQIVVLAHGFGGDQGSWNRILPFLTPDYRIVLFDLACAGTVNYNHYNFLRYSTLEAYADDLIDILDALGIRSCIYVGHSFSANIGMLASIKRRSLFTKLIAIGFTPSVLNDGDYRGGFELEEVETVFAAMQSNYVAWVLGSAPLVVGADMPDAVQEYCRTLFNMRPDITLSVARTVFLSDFRGILEFVRVPCCIIQTMRDRNVPPSVPTYTMNHLGGPRTLRMLNVEGHIPHISAPNLLAQELRRELRR